MQQVKAAPPDKRNALLMRAMTGVSVPSATTLCRRNPYLGGPNAPHWGQPFVGMTTADLLTSFSKAPFTWNYLGTKLPMEFVAGFVGATQDPDTLALRPEIGWAVREQ